MNPAAGRPPVACAVAFKEWAGVCRALAEGRQSLILRKGGIAEGPGGFRPEYDAFWLYPTRVHQAEQGLREPTPDEETGGDTIALGALAVVELVAFADREERLGPLTDLHVWTDETIRRRFHYRRPGLWVLGVRVFRRPEPYRIAATPEHAGCKTWVPLDEPLSTLGLGSAVGDEEHRRRMDRIQAALATPEGGGES